MRSSAAINNQLLRSLTAADFELLAPHLSFLELPLEDDLEAPGQPLKYVYFLESGIASAVADADQYAPSRPVEIGLIGREGMTGVPIVLGTDRSSHSIYMQVAGEGHRIEAPTLQKAIKDSRTLHGQFLKYVQVYLAQITSTALANGRSKIEQRLARWLLMADDRIEEPVLALRHEFLALMLGVRRPGVTVAIHALEGKGLIKAARGQIRITDRDGLLAESDGCYGAPEAEFRSLFGDVQLRSD
jgi:CRP-like cAMP-binding protein